MNLQSLFLHRRFYLLLFLGSIIFSCKPETYDGAYCSEVKYYNPNTGTTSDYRLIIDAEEGRLDRINFLQGHLDEDEDHFDLAIFDRKGFTRFTSYHGYEYTVQIIGDAKTCFAGLPEPMQCLGRTENGSQCTRLTNNESGYCWQHGNQYNVIYSN